MTTWEDNSSNRSSFLPSIGTRTSCFRSLDRTKFSAAYPTPLTFSPCYRCSKTNSHLGTRSSCTRPGTDTQVPLVYSSAGQSPRFWFSESRQPTRHLATPPPIEVAQTVAVTALLTRSNPHSPLLQPSPNGFQNTSFVRLTTELKWRLQSTGF